MTKKDFELIAACIREDVPGQAFRNGMDGSRALEVRDIAAAAFADALATTNPRFDRARFLQACEVAS